jgi:integrase/recombinase XerD
MATSPRRGADRAALRDRHHQCPPPERRAAVLSPPQIARMLEIAEPRDAALVAVMAAGACRIGEVLLLCWSDIDALGTVTVPGIVTKTGRSRAFTLPAQALKHLEAWRSRCPASERGWLFPGHPVRQPLSVRAGQLAIQRLAERLGVQGVSSHSFRRSALTAAHQAGVPLRALAELSGHQSLASLQRYLDADAARVQADAARSLLFGPGEAAEWRAQQRPIVPESPQ